MHHQTDTEMEEDIRTPIYSQNGINDLKSWFVTLYGTHIHPLFYMNMHRFKLFFRHNYTVLIFLFHYFKILVPSPTSLLPYSPPDLGWEVHDLKSWKKGYTKEQDLTIVKLSQPKKSYGVESTLERVHREAWRQTLFQFMRQWYVFSNSENVH